MEEFGNKEEIDFSGERSKTPDVQRVEDQAHTVAKMVNANNEKWKVDREYADNLLKSLNGGGVSENEKVRTVVEQASDIKPYDKNWRVNGGEWAKALQIIDKNISYWYANKAWNMAFEQILGKGHVKSGEAERDGGSKFWILNDGTRVYLNKGIFSAESGYVTVRHPDGTEEKFNPDGIKVE